MSTSFQIIFQIFIDNYTLVTIGKMIPAPDIEAAYLRIKDHVRKTPLEHSPWLSQVSASNVYIKAGD